MQSESSSEPSTLPTDTPDSPKTGFRYHLNHLNQAIPKKLVDYKVRPCADSVQSGVVFAANVCLANGAAASFLINIQV